MATRHGTVRHIPTLLGAQAPLDGPRACGLWHVVVAADEVPGVVAQARDGLTLLDRSSLLHHTWALDGRRPQAR